MLLIQYKTDHPVCFEVSTSKFKAEKSLTVTWGTNLTSKYLVEPPGNSEKERVYEGLRGWVFKFIGDWPRPSSSP